MSLRQTLAIDSDGFLVLTGGSREHEARDLERRIEELLSAAAGPRRADDQLQRGGLSARLA